MTADLSNKRATLRFRLLLAAGLLAGAAIPGAFAQEQIKPLTDMNSQDEIKQYCSNIADAARDQRYLLQKQDLEKLQADVDTRMAELDKRRAEYEDWLKRRNDFMKQAEAGLIDVFKTMKADAAAPQLAEMNPLLAAAIVMRLPARQSGLILAEMEPQKAAMVASIMSQAANPNTSKDPS